MSIKISIIIPVYNAAEYLKETLNSILAQTMKEFELITVDDGSEDESLAILQSYQSRMPRMKVLCQKNSGPSAARNRALDEAQGEFVYFFDADDLLAENALENLYQKATEEQADLVIAKYDIFNAVKRFAVNNLNELVKIKDIPWSHSSILWTFSCSNKLFRKRLIDETGLRFPPVSYSEDGVFVMNFVYRAKKITGLDQVIFHYRRMTDAVHESITASVKEWKIRDYLEAHELIYLAIQDKCMREYPGYRGFEELKRKEPFVRQYSEEFLKKEITVLLNQFYKLFWNIDEPCIRLVAENLNRLLDRLDEQAIEQIRKEHPELPVKQLPVMYLEALNQAKLSVLLYPKVSNLTEFISCLSSLCTQSMVLYRIYVPETIKAVVLKKLGERHQILYIPCNGEQDFYEKVLQNMDTDYVMLADSRFLYDRAALLWLYRLAAARRRNFLSAVVYGRTENRTFGSSFLVKVMRRAGKALKGAAGMFPDGTAGNKIIRTEVLNKIRKKTKGNEKVLVRTLYRKGNYSVTVRCLVLANAEE